MKVDYVGSKKEMDKLKEKVGSMVEFVNRANAEISIIEVNSVEAVKDMPKIFSKPTFFYITTEDPSILKYLNNFNISGTIYSFFNKNLIYKRLNILEEDNKATKTVKSPVSKERIYAKAETIPPLPTIAQEVINLVADDMISINKIVEKIKMDQGLTASLLRLVNSPFYGIRKEITGIDRAVVMLGTDAIKKLVVAVSFRQFYTKNFAYYNTTGIRIWMHSFNVARLCEAISKLIPGIDSDAVYMAGLMHDIGKIILVDFLYQVATSPHDEEKQTGTNHMNVGEMVLTKWKVANFIIDAVKNHHNLTNKPINTILFYCDIIERMDKIDSNVIEEMSKKLNVNKDIMFNKIKEITAKFSSNV